MHRLSQSQRLRAALTISSLQPEGGRVEISIHAGVYRFERSAGRWLAQCGHDAVAHQDQNAGQIA
jgi:hypothetical protein